MKLIGYAAWRVLQNAARQKKARTSLGNRGDNSQADPGRATLDGKGIAANGETIGNTAIRDDAPHTTGAACTVVRISGPAAAVSETARPARPTGGVLARK